MARQIMQFAGVLEYISDLWFYGLQILFKNYTKIWQFTERATKIGDMQGQIRGMQHLTSFVGLWNITGKGGGKTLESGNKEENINLETLLKWELSKSASKGGLGTWECVYDVNSRVFDNFKFAANRMGRGGDIGIVKSGWGFSTT